MLSCAVTTYWLVACEISVTGLHAAPVAQERCVSVRLFAFDWEIFEIEPCENVVVTVAMFLQMILELLVCSPVWRPVIRMTSWMCSLYTCV